ncbi:hypothetical protein BDN72DRAFT_854531 [Pluteus cervinus]|uniref:Uncharacterized protein n=1 Tax=Pluteus cervinus TaxID=181527 RepID=A0ACD3B7U0_9AGAR|nr:hypothetical protein BDN72DRAFT_854531 [Pluteus cervinus]
MSDGETNFADTQNRHNRDINADQGYSPPQGTHSRRYPENPAPTIPYNAGMGPGHGWMPQSNNHPEFVPGPPNYPPASMTTAVMEETYQERVRTMSTDSGPFSPIQTSDRKRTLIYSSSDRKQLWIQPLWTLEFERLKLTRAVRSG